MTQSIPTDAPRNDFRAGNANGVVSAIRHHSRGTEIYRAGEEGAAWRVCVGAVRLDQHFDGQSRFAGVAVAGDIIGAEVLLFGKYTYSARALSSVALERWSDSVEQLAPRTLLQVFSGIERRSADSLALRTGTAAHRIGQLLGLIGRGLALGRSKVRVTLPTLRDIAEITGLTIETVSRTITSLRSNGELEIAGERCGREIWVVARSCVANDLAACSSGARGTTSVTSPDKSALPHPGEQPN